MKMKTTILPTLILIALLAVAAAAQKTNEFRSLAGGFTVNLPSETSGYSETGGLVLFWRLTDAAYEVGFLDRSKGSASGKTAAFSFDEFLRDKFGREANSPSLIHRKEITSGGFSGVEYKFDANGTIVYLRLIDAGKRIYQVKAEIPMARRAREPAVVAVMDSLRILTPDEVAVERARRIAAALPKELPQSPIVAKATTDAADLGLKGPVKSVMTEYASLDVRGGERSRGTVDRIEFDVNGAMVRKDDYAFTSEIERIFVFGYLDGKRVARRGRVESETRMPGIVVGKPFSGKFDPRFDELYTYKYLGGKLVEKSTFLGGTMLISRERYAYGKNRRQIEYFDGGTVPHSRVVFELDDAGLEQKVTVLERSGRFSKGQTQIIKYDAIDEQGNWTKRTFYKNYNFGGADNFQPESAWFREIKYY